MRFKIPSKWRRILAPATDGLLIHAHATYRNLMNPDAIPIRIFSRRMDGKTWLMILDNKNRCIMKCDIRSLELLNVLETGKEEIFEEK